jgi:D-xylose transport system substrate-binding protein
MKRSHLIGARARTRPRVMRSRVLIGIAAASLALLAACSSSSSGSSHSTASGAGGLVYFMIPDTVPSRYIQQDGPDFKAALAKLDPKVTVKFVNANGDESTQEQQARAAIAAGAKALVVVAADPPLSGGLLQIASQAKVPVIGYENVPIDGPMYAQVEFSPLEAGQLQGKYFAQEVTSGALGKYPVTLARLYGNQGDVYDTQMLKGQNQYLTPLISSGKIKVVCQAYTPNWAEASAVTEMQQCLSSTGNKVRAVLGFYDGITQGAIVAIDNAHLKAGTGAGDVTVFGGQNPTTPGLQYLIEGQQQDDVIKPFLLEAQAAAKLANAAVRGQKPPASLITQQVNDGSANVPTAFLNEDYITAGPNVGSLINKYVVQTNTETWAEICTSPITSSSICKTYQS